MLLSKLRKFEQDERGSVLAFVVIMFVFMILAAGMAVDFIRHETARADLQNALDRGVLAAAAFNQNYVDQIGDVSDDGELDDEYQALVEEYMKSRAFGANPVVDVDYTETMTEKRVAATATYDMRTYFLRIMGINSMRVPAVSIAKQSRNEIEISLVLDISGSMFNPDNSVTYTPKDDDGADLPEVTETRVTILKREAQAFVTNVMAGDTTADKRRRTFNLVPYSHQVSMSPEMAAKFTNMVGPNADGKHDLSYCVDFANSDYTQRAINSTDAIKQYQHFKWMNTQAHTEARAVNSCSGPENNIMPVSNDEAAINLRIANMGEENLTSVYMGVKWGVAMLDPGMRPVIDGLITDGVVPNLFSGLPRDYNPADVVKVVVVMSDGRNTWLPRMDDADYLGPVGTLGSHNYWKDNRPNRANEDGNNIGSRCTESAEGDAEVYPVNNIACNNTEGEFLTFNGVNTIDDSGDSIRRGDARLFEICKAARAESIVIYSIGFLAGSDANRALLECAGTSTRFFNATAENLQESFDAIADDIEKLKLTSSSS
ncbi:MAG: pilus assembly protein TadG-related protein [Pseudomonadota bacterium]